MTIRRLGAALLAVLLLSGLPSAADEETSLGTPEARVAEARADSIVSIRFLLKTQMTMMGQSRDRESSQEVHGVLLGADGLVVTANSHFEGGMAGGLIRAMGNEIDIKTQPTDFKVLFGAEEEEYEARLVARDSDLDLAFLQVIDLKGRTVHPMDLGDVVEPQVGSNLLALTRMGRGFDCVPTVTRLYVTARVERPRWMWAVGGGGGEAGLPVFTKGGQPVGFMAMQKAADGVEASDEGGLDILGLSGAAEGMGVFVLPIETVRPVVEAARKRIEELDAKDAEPEPPVKVKITKPGEEEPKDD